MKARSLIGEMVLMASIILISNLVVDIGDKDNTSRFIVQPLRMVGLCILFGVIGGFLSYKLKEKYGNPKQ